MKIWNCKIGETEDVPSGADFPMRQAVRDTYFALTGKEPTFIFSGWGGNLTKEELEVVSSTFKPPV